MDVLEKVYNFHKVCLVSDVVVIDRSILGCFKIKLFHFLFRLFLFPFSRYDILATARLSLLIHYSHNISLINELIFILVLHKSNFLSIILKSCLVHNLKLSSCECVSNQPTFKLSFVELFIKFQLSLELLF